jgi:hypothetical protein
MKLVTIFQLHDKLTLALFQDRPELLAQVIGDILNTITKVECFSERSKL